MKVCDKFFSIVEKEEEKKNANKSDIMKARKKRENVKETF